MWHWEDGVSSGSDCGISVGEWVVLIQLYPILSIHNP